MAHAEPVVTTKMGTVIVVRNAAIMVAATVISNGLLRSLCALWLLLALRLLCALTALHLLCALTALRLLCVLWLLLRSLCALRLRLLGALRLRLVLRRLCFSSASALFLLSFLCECRNGGSEK
jgi:hypothetical protein